MIRGTSGARKTLLVRSIIEALHDAAALHFDDYATTSVFPSDLQAWIRTESDPDDWRTPQLAADLRTLRSGRPICLPDDATVVEPNSFVIVEEPFGIAHRVHFLEFADTPEASRLHNTEATSKRQ